MYKDGERQTLEPLLTDCAGIEFAFDPASEYRITVAYAPKTALEAAIFRAEQVLLRAEGQHRTKRFTYRSLKEAADLAAFTEIIRQSDLPEAVKQRLLETM